MCVSPRWTVQLISESLQTWHTRSIRTYLAVRCAFPQPIINALIERALELHSCGYLAFSSGVSTRHRPVPEPNTSVKRDDFFPHDQRSRGSFIMQSAFDTTVAIVTAAHRVYSLKHVLRVFRNNFFLNRVQALPTTLIVRCSQQLPSTLGWGSLFILMIAYLQLKSSEIE